MPASTTEVEERSGDGCKTQQTRAGVLLLSEQMLDGLPSIYTTELYQTKSSAVYQQVDDRYYGAGKNIYAT